ncbi:hypothetical protein KIN20_019854 [Parelaphostrongylus tenuis]|uniref:Uncharacterized protein n=1 Tax=Parelaphostrongylus tenuis TaxID=148309 RepID=A0AAD5QT90_PARTN|nr:hypothetical protein KIN20_019854 [Parelaphostrongylus tenuis]
MFSLRVRPFVSYILTTFRDGGLRPAEYFTGKKNLTPKKLCCLRFFHATKGAGTELTLPKPHVRICETLQRSDKRAPQKEMSSSHGRS